MSVLNDVETQIGWLEWTRPAYLLSYSETLEHLALAYQCRARRGPTAMMRHGHDIHGS